MAAADMFASDSPLAVALQNAVQPKLAEFGWTTGSPEDSTLFEYILLMLVNEKSESQIASELSNDLLDLGPENPETQQFAQWLFQQIAMLQQQLNPQPAQAAQSGDGGFSNTQHSAHDTTMDGTVDAQTAIPTGPKAMRNGSGSGSGAKGNNRGGRLFNQLNSHMDRNDDRHDPLKRVRGNNRISHSREPPKGPRNINLTRGLEAAMGGRGNMGMQAGPGHQNAMNGAMGMPMSATMGAIPGMLMGGMNPALMNNPEQAMALLAMYEQQAAVMTQMFQPAINPNFQHNAQHGNQRGNQRGYNRGNRNGSNGRGAHSSLASDAGDSMEVDSGPGRTMCRFNLHCTKPDCPFVHQSPAAPEGTLIDMENECSFGVACRNSKCAGRHPSPAQKNQYKAEKECAFFPNCLNRNCPFKHPDMPPCRNGADCTTPDCKFWHNSVMCKYNPCTNVRCPYKHAEGQKKPVKDRVWIANKGEEKKEHVSERKFVNEDAEEELIIPGQANGNDMTPMATTSVDVEVTDA
ncbi:hypothetical protein P154DRAFT_199115 [Amniculicola lignicola CBS 123094]|uniref:Nab2-like CCCH zinc finger domain-containing protein n=1 Tax=Amniculicola lignicola CBS 123094 TaxID=1392246 RepID=A0A6A5WFD6_9PLEO|nr:hypothetical protein P154DRAFT_199115 [Amniculicola lignicola CBS 123094]